MWWEKGAKKAVFEAVPAGVRALWAKVWPKVWPKVETNPDAKSAAQKVAIDPENAKRLTALEMAIEDLLTNLAKSEPEWMAGLQALMAEAEVEAVASTIVNVDGTDNQTLVNVTEKNVVAKVEGGANFH